ncbi:MAG: hypothetical protein HY721_34740 [Planctomycetes bacterium]|nr:hypothetical protein [Planctomycetota bacterium]
MKGLVAVLIEGPSRAGHYFRPAYATTTGAWAACDEGPLIRPDGSVHRWSIDYSPAGAGGRGRIAVRLDGEEAALDLEPGHRGLGARLDRFGLLTHFRDGHFVEIYVDDVSYTAERGAPR